jgi:hypothetical protein
VTALANSSDGKAIQKQLNEWEREL